MLRNYKEVPLVYPTLGTKTFVPTSSMPILFIPLLNNHLKMYTLLEQVP